MRSLRKSSGRAGRLNAPTRPDLTKELRPWPTDDEDNTWPAEGLRIYVAFHLLFPIAWASYCSAKRKADRLQQPFVSPGSDAYRQLVAYQHAQKELEVELRRLLEGRGFERFEQFELWGRLKSPNKDAEHIPASALGPQGAWTIDFEAGTADGQGVPLFDLRLRRLPADAAPPPIPVANERVMSNPTWAQKKVRSLLDKAVIREGMRKAEVARILEGEMEKDAKTGGIRRVLKASYMEDQLVPWGAWPPSALK
jgi:hypothetical protein